MKLSIALSGVDIPTTADFDQHPDFHTITSFFIGWVFIVSLSCIASSPAAKSILHITFRKRTPRWFHDSVKTPSDVESEVSSISPAKRDCRTLLLIMFLAFATGSLANFVSLLSFDSSSGLCDFVVAWGELTFMTARLMGLLVLLFGLRQLGIARWESIVFIIWLVIGLVFIFFNSAVATGITRPATMFTSGQLVSFCYRKHFLPASLVTSILYILLEMTVLGRFWFLMSTDRQSQSRRGWNILSDVRILRTLSLILLDGLTVVPSAVVTNILGEFIPLSLGSLAVLAAFSMQHDDPPIPRMISAPFDFLSIKPPSLPERLPTHQMRSPPSGVPPLTMYDHPYSAIRLKDSSSIPERWMESPLSVKSSRTSMLAPDLKHQPNNSLGLTVDVIAARRQASEVDFVPPSTGRSEVYPASVMSSRVVKATKHEQRMRPKLVIVTNAAVGRNPGQVHTIARRSQDQSTLDISPPLNSRFSLPTTKSDSPSTISYPNPVVVDSPNSSPYSDMETSLGARAASDSGSEDIRMELEGTGYSDVIQSNLARRSRASRLSFNNEHEQREHRPLPPVP